MQNIKKVSDLDTKQGKSELQELIKETVENKMEEVHIFVKTKNV